MILLLRLYWFCRSFFARGRGHRVTTSISLVLLKGPRAIRLGRVARNRSAADDEETWKQLERPRATWLVALAALQATPCLAALLHTDTFSFNRTGTTQHFGDAQFTVLNYPSINGIYMDMGSDGSRSLITAAGNDLMQQYNNFLSDYTTQPDASAEADAIYNYSIAHSTSTGPRPHWVFLNEIGANYSSPPTGTGSNWYNTGSAGATYRQWVIDAVARLHDVYNFDVVVASPGRTALKVQQSGYNPFASDWQTLASKATIYVETFVSGPDVMNSGGDYASRLNWVKSYYQSEMNAYKVYAGVDPSRLGAGENYTNNATYDYYGRAGLASASDWDYVIMLREDALRTLNAASVDAYAWGGNAMGITEAEQVQHELYYRTRLVLPGQQPQWLPDDAYTIGDAAMPVPLSWSQPLNWLGNGVVNGVPNSVPNSPGAVANFFRTNTAARTITLDGDKTIGTLTFNSLEQLHDFTGQRGIDFAQQLGERGGCDSQPGVAFDCRPRSVAGRRERDGRECCRYADAYPARSAVPARSPRRAAAHLSYPAPIPSWAGRRSTLARC